MGGEGPPRRAEGAPPGVSGRGRCACCEGMLLDTQRAGQPTQTDHMPGCTCFERATKVWRFAGELRRTAAELRDQASSDDERRRCRYLQRCGTELSDAARASDPAIEVARLGRKYKTEFEKGAEHAKDAGILSQACYALANSKDPGYLSQVAMLLGSQAT